MGTSICKPCAPGAGTERVRYYPRQLLNAADMTTEQVYLLQKHRRHNRYLHGWGVVCGLALELHPADGKPWQIRVCPGYAVSPQGDEIHIAEAVDVDLATGATSASDPCADAWPCPPTGRMPSERQPCVFLAARYTECPTRPEKVHPAGCGCNEAACEYSRIRDGFELKVLWALPESHREAAQRDQAWRDTVDTWRAGAEPDPTGGQNRTLGPAPVPPCPPCPADPWVVLGRICFPRDPQARIDATAITYTGRRVLWSVSAVQTLIAP